MAMFDLKEYDSTKHDRLRGAAQVFGIEDLVLHLRVTFHPSFVFDRRVSREAVCVFEKMGRKT